MNFFKMIKMQLNKVFGIFNRGNKTKQLSAAEEKANEADMARAFVPEIDPRKEILKASNAQLNKLKMLATFFSNNTLNLIKDQTEIVNEIFVKNKDLNFKKLEQFNYYYTENLLTLLNKLKKGKEENILILNEKLIKAKTNANNTKIDKIDLKRVDNERRKYANVISEVLAANYRELCNFGGSVGIKYSLNDTQFLYKFPNENYYSIEFEKYEELTNIVPDLFYYSSSYSIQKKLMGKLNKNVFNIQYMYTFKTKGNDTLYLFQIKDSHDFFIYAPDKKCFKLVDSTEIMIFTGQQNSSWYIITTKLEEEIQKIEDLENRIANEKFIKDENVIKTLEDYYTKINDDGLLTSLSDVDVDRQFLNEVLKLEQFKI